MGDQEKERLGEQDGGEVAAKFAQAFQRMQQTNAQFRAKWIKAAEGKIKPRACAVHPEVMLKVDIEQSIRDSWREKVNVFTYEPCVDCEAEAMMSRADRWIVNAGVPARIAHASLDNWKARTPEDAANLASVREWTRRKRGILIMRGGFGLGKSHLGVGILRLNGRGIYRRQRALLLEHRQTYSNPKARSIMDAFKAAPLAIIDEVYPPVEKDEWPLIEEIIEYRFDEDMALAMTTNLPLPELEQLFGGRLWDRMRKATRILNFAGNSWRKELRDA